MKNIKKIVLASLCVLPLSAMAIQNGVAVSYGSHAFGSEMPNGIQGYNIAYTMQPDSWQWGNFALLLNFSYGHYFTNDYSSNSVLNTYAIAPVIRWYFATNSIATPFLTGSVGPAYLSNTRIGDRDLGVHYSFQDQLGLGLAYGKSKQFYTTLQFLHYSNAGISQHNNGMTLPVYLTLGYQF